MKIRIYTDGACSENPGAGGWAAVFNTNEDCETISGNEVETTNNRMELMAVIEALKEILKRTKKTKVINEYELYSDSAYVINSINNKWIDKWQKNDWKTSKNEKVKNKDLLKLLIKYYEKVLNNDKIYDLKLIKVKGHSGNTFNELVDKLAKKETLIAKQNLFEKE